MLTETGRIVAIENDALWVETIQKSTCGQCAAQKGCGQSLLSKMGQSSGHLRVLLQGRSPSAYQLGEEVTIAIADDLVVKSALLIYLLPLCVMLVFSLFAHTYFNNEGLTIASAILGLVLGGLLLRWHAFSQRNNSQQQPIIIDHLAKATPV